MNTADLIDNAIVKLEDGIIHVIFGSNTILTLGHAKKIVEYRLKISDEKEFPLYVDIRGIVSVDEQTRKYLSGKEGTKRTIAAAIQVGSPMSKLIGNIFVQVDRPDKPTRLFTDKVKAIKWLERITLNHAHQPQKLLDRRLWLKN